MADKNITLRQKNTSGVYDKLYTKTTATQSKLSTETAELFGDGTSDADAALAKIAETVKSIGNVQVKVVDPSGNPIQGARVTGLYGTPTTASDGTAHGVLQTNPISISSPYIDLKDQTADVNGYVGSFNALTVTLPIVGENSITRITSSKTVKFSKAVKSVDVCCVGGGGGGGEVVAYYDSVTLYADYGAGGGGGGITNTYGLIPTSNQSYQLIVGSGGQTGYQNIVAGTSSFMTASAVGGKSPSHKTPLSKYDLMAYGGPAGGIGCGNGGDQRKNGESNTTVSEFDDGVTFYSGGGGGGGQTSGGTPNGASGGYQSISGSMINASTPGIGGGGGGGAYDSTEGNTYNSAYPSTGGPGLVAIRFHF